MPLTQPKGGTLTCLRVFTAPSLGIHQLSDLAAACPSDAREPFFSALKKKGYCTNLTFQSEERKVAHGKLPHKVLAA